MNYNSDRDLRYFTRDFITTHGGVVDNSGRSMDAVLPQDLAEKLSVSEYLQLDFEDNDKEKNIVLYGSPLLESMVNIARERIPVTSCTLHFDYLKSAGFDNLVGNLFTFANAVGKVEKTAPTRSQYILLHCHYIAQSDEQKEGLITLVYNRETFTEVSAMADNLNRGGMSFEAAHAGTGLSGKEIDRLEAMIRTDAETYLAERLHQFEASMNRRYRRDIKNLNQYYQALEQEMKASLERAGQSPQLIAERQEKIALLPTELAAKTDDLFNKYSIEVSLKLAGAMLLQSPVVKVFLQVSVGRKAGTVSLIYNPVMKTIEPLRCSRCSQATYKPFFGSEMEIHCPQCTSW